MASALSTIASVPSPQYAGSLFTPKQIINIKIVTIYKIKNNWINL
jgi:hypothetical protein